MFFGLEYALFWRMISKSKKMDHIKVVDSTLQALSLLSSQVVLSITESRILKSPAEFLLILSNISFYFSFWGSLIKCIYNETVMCSQCIDIFSTMKFCSYSLVIFPVLLSILTDIDDQLQFSYKYNSPSISSSILLLWTYLCLKLKYLLQIAYNWIWDCHRIW